MKHCATMGIIKKWGLCRKMALKVPHGAISRKKGEGVANRLMISRFSGTPPRLSLGQLNIQVSKRNNLIDTITIRQQTRGWVRKGHSPYLTPYCMRGGHNCGGASIVRLQCPH